MNREQRRCKHPKALQYLESEQKISGAKHWVCRKCQAKYTTGGFSQLLKDAMKEIK